MTPLHQSPVSRSLVFGSRKPVASFRLFYRNFGLIVHHYRTRTLGVHAIPLSRPNFFFGRGSVQRKGRQAACHHSPVTTRRPHGVRPTSAAPFLLRVRGDRRPPLRPAGRALSPVESRRRAGQVVIDQEIREKWSAAAPALGSPSPSPRVESTHGRARAAPPPPPARRPSRAWRAPPPIIWPRLVRVKPRPPRAPLLLAYCYW
jgi:hypothetical protein